MHSSNNPDKVIVVAEFTTNHIGNMNRLKTMIRYAKESGADMIKLQKRDLKTFYTADEMSKPYRSPFGKTFADYRYGIELTKEQFKMVDRECEKQGIQWFASVLDYPSYEFLKDFNMPLIKLPSTISNDRSYMKRIAKEYNGDIVISTGFTDTEYEKFILDLFGNKSNMLYLLQCTSAYPAPQEIIQLGVVRHYSKLSMQYPNIISGYSSHDPGALGCQMAVAAGAKMIEKHVKLGNLDWVHFDEVAVDMENGDFKIFVDQVRHAEKMCGSEIKSIKKEEHHKYHVKSKKDEYTVIK
jgi:N-acetylneuraminate synthase